MQLVGGPIRFIDLFAGIGAFRLAFEAAGARCVFACEWDRFAAVTYQANFGDTPAGDVRKIKARDLPQFDVLCAGFPCQAFSKAGVSKKKSLGRPHGFADETSGTLFYEVARILKDRRPAAFVLENVKNLLHHDHGRTFRTIQSVVKRLGYLLDWRVYDAATVVPQKRERIFLVGFRDQAAGHVFRFPVLRKRPGGAPELRDVLDRRVAAKYRLSDRLWATLQRHAARHAAAGNGFGCRVTPRSGVARTLSARYHKDGAEILVPMRGGPPRRLTPRECARLMGYPDSFEFPVSDTQAYRQLGNSIVVPVVKPIARALVRALESASVSQSREVADRRRDVA